MLTPQLAPTPTPTAPPPAMSFLLDTYLRVLGRGVLAASRGLGRVGRVAATRPRTVIAAWLLVVGLSFLGVMRIKFVTASDERWEDM